MNPDQKFFFGGGGARAPPPSEASKTWGGGGDVPPNGSPMSTHEHISFRFTMCDAPIATEDFYAYKRATTR